ARHQTSRKASCESMRLFCFPFIPEHASCSEGFYVLSCRKGTGTRAITALSQIKSPAGRRRAQQFIVERKRLVPGIFLMTNE
ncbi:hypothetical protein, partial [Atlantibacter hermannii]|uniref:hypothetical protein n=1 Tax=Atlantibacter hermannii TaxID=565 RepID=UPI0028AA4E52